MFVLKQVENEPFKSSKANFYLDADSESEHSTLIFYGNPHKASTISQRTIFTFFSIFKNHFFVSRFELNCTLITQKIENENSFRISRHIASVPLNFKLIKFWLKSTEDIHKMLSNFDSRTSVFALKVNSCWLAVQIQLNVLWIQLYFRDITLKMKF